MLGVILCGGNSSRMGTDKGLISVQQNETMSPASTWAETASQKISSLGLSVVLSVNSNQYTSYASIFPAGQLIIDNASLSIRGPLYGLLSVHLQFPDKTLLALACDMPFMETEIIKELLDHYYQQPGYDAYVFTNEGEPEPLCAIYTSRALQHIFQLYQSGQLVKHSMKFMLDHINPFSIPLKEDQKKLFLNINAHAGLNGL